MYKKSIREWFALDPRITYMNSGTEGSMPRPVLSAHASALHTWARSPSYAFAFDPVLGDWQRRNRQATGSFIGTNAENVSLVDNTTEGLSMVLLGLPLKDGDEILTTNQDFGSLNSVLRFLKETRGVRIVRVSLGEPSEISEGILREFERHMSPNTKVLCLSHITYATGLRLPVEEVCALASSRSVLTLVDGAHALGMIPVDVSELGCDFYIAAGHKWLNGPPGTGVLFIRNGRSNPYRLRPPISEIFADEDEYTIQEMNQIRGCTNAPGFTAMVAAMEFCNCIGVECIAEHILSLADYLKARVVDTWGTDALLSAPPDTAHRSLSSGLVSFVPSRDPGARFDAQFVTTTAWKLIWGYNIWIRYVAFKQSTGEGRITYAIRASTAIFNNRRDVDHLVSTLVRLA